MLLESGTKYFVAQQQCKRKPLLNLHDNNKHFYIPDSYMCINYKKERTVVFQGINGYANLPQCYVIRTFLTLVSRTFIVNVTFFLFLNRGYPVVFEFYK
jgi:hypothetical protein